MATRQLYIVIMIYCVSDYEKSHTTALDTNPTCACTYACDFSQVCRPSPNCNRENVALGKPANVSTMYPDSGPACVAVNGNTGTTYTPTTSGQTPNCIHTAEGDNNAWWQVNLGRAYTVTNISVFIRDGFASRMDGVSITVDGQDCYTFPSGTTGSPVQKQICCSTPRTGSLVKFSRTDLLNICEVQVWVCKDGFFGKDCNETCSSKCRNDLICDNYNGTCLPDGACSCSFGCNFTQSCIPTDNCRKENVALGKPAKISSTFSDTQGSAGPACVAVNGNTGTTYETGEHPNCIHTGLNDQNVWWEVDLGRIYTITEITVYIRENEADRMDNVKITVDDKHCYTFPTGTTRSPPVKNISCSTPLQGKIVRLSRNAGLLNFCEVQVWVCKAGFYGANCSQTCGKCINSSCNALDGVCLGGCQDGYETQFCNEICRNKTYGRNCSLQCGRCNNSIPCDVFNGSCTACELYFKLSMCTECILGYYGENCSTHCGHCKDGRMCNNTDGVCPDGCEDGYEFPLCNQTCSNRMYGPNCSRECGHCLAERSCNVTNGACPEGCEAGYNTSLCNETCSNRMYGPNCSRECGHCLAGSTCNVTNGACPEGCDAGYNTSLCNETCSNRMYGPNCSRECGHCLAGRSCNVTNGACPEGCDAGYNTSLCNETCSNRMYGLNCSKECGHCLAGRSCNVTNGECPEGCDAGYNTSLCNEKCPDGTWGIQCNMSCGKCNFTSCRHDIGTCENGCVQGFNGKLCLNADSPPDTRKGNDTGLIVGIVFGVVLSVAILVVILFIMRRHGYGFKARHFRSTADRTSRLDSSNNSLAPLTTEPTANKSTVKPKVAVKPRIRDDTSSPVYENVVLGNSSGLDEQHDVPSTNDMAVQEDDIFLEDSEQLYSNDEVIYAALKSSQNLDHIQRTLVDKLTSGALFQEFKHIKKDIRKPHEIALLPHNIKKNRFKVIVPYDCNRVILKDEYEDGGATDYINASFVKGVQSDTQYIAAQGPRDNTVTDFWRMVLQERVTDIVMVTSLQEGGKNKCYEYWPAKDTTQTYGPVKVTGLDVQCRAYFYTRIFGLRLSDDDSKGAERKVTQYHFTAWPDHGIPTVTSLVDFWRFVKSRANACGVSAPLLVHCSAGVGRTGTYIGLDIGMDKCLQNGKINIAAIVDRMRDDRTTMVQTPEQYVFLYKALLEAYTGRETKLSIDQFETVISRSISLFTPNERIDKEFQVVMQMRSLTAEQSHSIAIADENRSKNRSEAILPSDGHIVYLTEHVHKRNQYINAVYMSTFTKPRGAILTQLPLPDTLVDFWRMVFGNEVTTVVSLGDTCDETNIENFCRYWPLTKDAVQISPYCVTLKSSSRLGKHLVTYTLTLNKQDITKTREIQLLRYEGWSSEIPDKSEIYQLVEILDTNTSVGPIVIQCTDGGAKSGLFCCIRDIISRVTFDHDVDIYMTVRHVQSVRPEAVTKVEQYRFCYEVAQEKVREQNVYANI